MKSVTVDFFLGANSESGFVSHFSQLQNPNSGYRTYIIKAGAGTGKSTMMKKIAENNTDREELVERIHCSSDPDSLDGVILHRQKINIVDGTPPHAMEPRHPIICEQIVSFYDAFCPENMKGKESEVVSLTAVISEFHRRFCEMLRCANLLLDSNIALISPYVDHLKMRKAATNLMKKICRKKRHTPGEVRVRLLSAFTPKGLYTYRDTVKALCSKIYLLHDDYRVCSDEWMRLIRDFVTDAGYDCYVCYSPFHPEGKIDHILVPELSAAFLTESRFISFEGLATTKVIHATRFYDTEVLKRKKQRLSFCKKTAAELIKEGISVLERAKTLHDELEIYNKDCVDFKKIDRLTQQFLKQLNEK